MKFFSKTLAALALFALMGAAPARAELGYIIGAATVEDVTTTACTLGRNQTVDMFGNGVDLDQVWELQRERGSPGSGAWRAISGYTDIFPAINGATAVGGPTQVARYISEAPGCYRLFMRTDTAGTGQIQIVTNQRAPTAVTLASHVTAHDEFLTPLLPVTTAHAPSTPSYVVFIGSGNAAVLGVVEGAQEGIITLSSGDSGATDTDLSVLSYGLITHGSLVSSGLTIVETRIHMSQITDGRVNFGLADRINAATEEEPFQANSNVVVEGQVASFTNAAVFLFDTDAVVDQWGAASMNANAIGNVADEYSMKAPVAATYQTLRLEVSAAGHAYWYVDGLLLGAEPLALATTAVLIPHITAGSADDGTGTVNKLNVDYLRFITPRPAT